MVTPYLGRLDAWDRGVPSMRPRTRARFEPAPDDALGGFGDGLRRTGDGLDIDGSEGEVELDGVAGTTHVQPVAGRGLPFGGRGSESLRARRSGAPAAGGTAPVPEELSAPHPAGTGRTDRPLGWRGLPRDGRRPGRAARGEAPSPDPSPLEPAAAQPEPPQRASRLAKPVGDAPPATPAPRAARHPGTPGGHSTTEPAPAALDEHDRIDRPARPGRSAGSQAPDPAGPPVPAVAAPPPPAHLFGTRTEAARTTAAPARPLAPSPPAHPDGMSRGASRDVEPARPAVQVSIGRIQVRVPEPASAPAAPPRPARERPRPSSLDDYLDARTRRQR